MSDNDTIQLISLALEAATMRQTAIAINVANANTQHYKTIDVVFEQQITNLSKSSHGNQQDPLSSQEPTTHHLNEHYFENIQPLYQQRDTPSSLDEQIALNIQNATQYRALIKGLNHKLAIMRLALHGNNAS